MKLPPPRATVGIVAVTVAAWAIVAATGLDDQVAVRAGFIPARFGAIELAGAVPAWATPLTATLVHAGLLHLAFNMLMLGFCGRFVEASLRVRGMIVLYVVGAFAAAGAQWLAEPLAMGPMIGASGAVSAIVAAYALLYGERRTTIRTRWLADAVHVAWLAAAWIGLQLMIGLVTLDGVHPIAIAAHIGGSSPGWRSRGRCCAGGYRKRLAAVR